MSLNCFESESNKNNIPMSMKTIILAMFTFVFISCEQEAPNESTVATVYDIEGKWLFSADTPGISDQGISNTMYLFENGVRYTYYCIADDCLSQYKAFEAGDANAIPETNEYSFQNGVLTIDLNFGNIQVLPLSFECEGDRINFRDPESPDRYDWVKLDANLNNCN